MILTSAQRKRFMRLLDQLTIYVNERLGIMDARRLKSGPRQSIGESAQTTIMQALWKNLDLIDDFVADNPAHLARRDLNDVAAWRQGLFARFTAQRLSSGRLAFCIEENAFEVRGISRKIETMITEEPTFVETMIVPFEGVITYTMAIMEFPVSVGPGLLKMLDEKVSKIERNGNVWSSASQLIALAPAIEKALDERQVANVVEEAENAMAAALPMAGHHKGVLAGLSDEERRKKIDEHDRLFVDDSEYDDDSISLVKSRSRSGTTKTAAADLLRLVRKDDLLSWAFFLMLDRVAGLKKDELIERIISAIADENGEAAYDLAESCTPLTLEFLHKVSDAGGRLVLNDSQISPDFDVVPPYEPVLFLFSAKKSMTYVIPEEFREVIRNLDWDALARKARLRLEIGKIAAVAADLRGIVPMGEFIDDVQRIYPEQEDEEEIAILAFQAASKLPLYVPARLDNDLYLLDPGLADYYLADNPDDAYISQEVLAVEGPLQGLLEDYLDEQNGKAPRPILSEMLDYPVASLWRVAQPGAQALRAWFDENVPDGSDDYGYADSMVLKFVNEVKWGVIGADAITNYLGILEDAGSTIDEAHLQSFLNVLTEFMNSQPIWPNNGWAPNELIRRIK